MKLDPDNIAFGRHETFPLRFSWLPKGVQALEKDPKVFESPDSTVKLGVGRNMVTAMRYWLRASQMIEPNSYQLTDLGRLLLHPEDGYDPFLEDESTIWLLHWLIASNANLATSFFWFFNKFHKPEFTSGELVTALGDYIKDSIPEGRRPAINTIKSDATVLPRMYTQTKITHRMPLEEALDSPFALLRLIEHKEQEKKFVSLSAPRPSLSHNIVGYAVTTLMTTRHAQIMPIEDLMYSRDEFAAPGSVFRITENDFLTKLEQLVDEASDKLEIRESSSIHQLYRLAEFDPIVFLKAHYESSLKEAAA